MVAPAVAAAGISAAGNVLGGLLGRKSSAKDQMILQYGLNKQAFMDQKAHEDFWNTQQLQFAQQQFARQVQRDTHGIRERVADARGAGLHPLFALGANVGSSPSIGFSSPTGSAAGVGLAVGGSDRARSTLGTVGREIGNILLAAEQAKQQERENDRQAKMDRARLRVLSADASRSEAEAMLAHSRVKREEQRANQTRPAQTTALPDRPLEATIEDFPRKQVPTDVRQSRIRVQMPSGKWVWVTAQDVSELGSELEYIQERGKDWLRQLGRNVKNYWKHGELR